MIGREMAKLLGAILFISGCTYMHTSIDSFTLYPDNKYAQKWGVLRFYSQYPKGKLSNHLIINLPSNKTLSGHLTYVQETGIYKEDRRFMDDFYYRSVVGFRVFGADRDNKNTLFIEARTPRTVFYSSDKMSLNINTFGDNLGLNCQGDFNQRQNSGVLECQLTNGMKYRGTINRMFTK